MPLHPSPDFVKSHGFLRFLFEFPHTRSRWRSRRPETFGQNLECPLVPFGSNHRHHLEDQILAFDPAGEQLELLAQPSWKWEVISSITSDLAVAVKQQIGGTGWL